MELYEPQRRADTRIPIPPTPVYALESEDRFFFGYATNISRSGMLVTSYMKCAVGKEYDLEFALPQMPDILSCRSSVRWCQESALALEGPNRQGLKFIEMPADMSRNIDGWVKSRLSIENRQIGSS